MNNYYRANYYDRQKGFLFCSINNKISLSSAKDAIYLRPSNYEDGLKYVKEVGINKIFLDLRDEYKKDISDICDCSSIEYLRIVGEPLSFEPLKSLANLIHLNIQGDLNFDLSKLQKIKTFICFPKEEVLINNTIPTLKTLIIRNYDYQKTIQINLSLLSKTPNLVGLGLTAMNLSGFENISKLRHLQILEMNMIRSHFDVSYLNSNSSLKVLLLEDCNKVENYESIFECENIKYLHLLKMPSLSTLDSIRKLNKLKTIIIAKTEILSGDLRPLLDIEDFRFFRNDTKVSYKNDFNKEFDWVYDMAKSTKTYDISSYIELSVLSNF